MAAIEISSWTELNAVRADLTAHYIQTRDLLKTDADYAGIGDVFVPLSRAATEFSGIYDMQGFKIEGIRITLSSALTSGCCGFFGLLNGGTLKNGIFDDFEITTTNLNYNGVVGIAYANGELVQGIKLVNSRLYGKALNGIVGGISSSGATGATVEYCACVNSSVGRTASSSSYYNGGIVGYHLNATGTVRRCAVRGSTINIGNGPSGGVATTGGLIGCFYANAGPIEDCYVDDTTIVTGTTGSNTKAGGITTHVAAGTAHVRRCWVGVLDYPKATSTRRGVICNDTAGGVATDCYYDSATSVASDDGGATAKTTAEMYQQATFTNWDFEDVWYIREGEDYPRLVSVDTLIVPSIVGETQASAEGIITAAFFIVGTITGEYSDTVPIGVVISQSPVAGANAEIGSAIDFTVSLGPSMATMPNIIGLDIDAADALLLSSMLTTGVVSAVSGVGELYTVIAQQYPPGEELEIGTAVNYTILVPSPDLAGFKTVIGYDNILSRSDVTLTASSTAAGTFVENIADGNTYDYWLSGEGVS